MFEYKINLYLDAILKDLFLKDKNYNFSKKDFLVFFSNSAFTKKNLFKHIKKSKVLFLLKKKNFLSK